MIIRDDMGTAYLHTGITGLENFENRSDIKVMNSHILIANQEHLFLILFTKITQTSSQSPTKV